MKQCKNCLETLQNDKYYKTKSGGLFAFCIKCDLERKKFRRLTKRARVIDAISAASPHRKAHRIEYQRKFRERNREKLRAWNMVARHIRNGKITKTPCTLCGSNLHLEAHHEDYLNPDKVTWYCRKHHLKIHNKLYMEYRYV